MTWQLWQSETGGGDQSGGKVVGRYARAGHKKGGQYEKEDFVVVFGYDTDY